MCTESSPLSSTLAMLGQTGPSWLSASQSFVCGELHQAGQVVVLIPSPSSHAQLDSLVVSPFVEVLQSRPPARSLITPAEATFARYRPIRCDWWRLAVP